MSKFFKNDFLKNLSVDFDFEDGFLSLDDKNIKNLYANIKIQNGIFVPTLIKFDLLDFNNQLEIKGDLKKFQVFLKSNGKYENENVNILANFKKQKDFFNLKAKINFSSKEKFFVESNIDSNFITDLKNFQKYLKNFQVKAKNIYLDKFNKFIPADFKISGYSNFVLDYTNEKLRLNLIGNNLNLKNKYFSVLVENIGSFETNIFNDQNSIELSYKNGKINAKSPSVLGVLQLPLLNINIDFFVIFIICECNNHPILYFLIQFFKEICNFIRIMCAI